MYALRATAECFTNGRQRNANTLSNFDDATYRNTSRLYRR